MVVEIITFVNFRSKEKDFILENIKVRTRDDAANRCIVIFPNSFIWALLGILNFIFEFVIIHNSEN